MKFMEFPIYIALCSMLLGFIFDFTAQQFFLMTLLAWGAYATGRKVDV